MTTIRVEVAYALPEEQYLIEIDLEAGASVQDVLEKSGLLDKFPALKKSGLSLGIFSKPTSPDALVADGDRIEIYRPLTIDPKDARRLRAAAKKKKT